MNRLFYFFYRYRAFFTFLILEVLCAWMIFVNNQYQSAAFFNSSNRMAAGMMGFTQNVSQYFSLRDINVELANENAQLRTKLEKRNQSLFSLEIHETQDPAIINRFEFISAKVVSNTTDLFKNHITINQGRDAGIEPGMAVISTAGVIGKVKSVSEHYSVVISVLNSDMHISSVIKRTGNIGTIQWDGIDPRYANLEYIPRHVKPVAGDSVVTSGYNAIFPDGVLVGLIREVELSEEAPFYELKVELAQDFTKLSFVEIVRSNMKQEMDSLKISTGVLEEDLK
jgi:rod shape-determining protein MreC